MGIATLSLLGLFGAYLMGRAFGGRGIGIAAVLLLMVTPIYLEQAHVLRAEGPSTGLMVLAVGAAFMWWEHPIGRSGTAYCTLSVTALVDGCAHQAPRRHSHRANCTARAGTHVANS